MASYEVVIHYEPANEDSPIAGGDGSEAKKTTGKDDAAGTAAVNVLKKVMGVRTLASFADQVISYNVQTVALRTGAEEQQQRLSFTYNVAKKIGGAVMTIATGAAVGGLPGALVGLAVSAVSTAISYSQKTEQQRTERAIESVGLGFMNARAGGSVASFSQSRQIKQ